jgi:hypothetical protein
MRGFLSKSAVGIGIVFLLTLGAALPTAATGSRTYVTKCDHVSYKPHVIVFACADGGFSVTRLHWHKWSTRWAVAGGVFHLNDCQPDCAGGTFHRRRGVLLLTRRLSCPSVGKSVFRHITIRYTHRSGNPNLRWAKDLKGYCPF